MTVSLDSQKCVVSHISYLECLVIQGDARGESLSREVWALAIARETEEIVGHVDLDLRHSWLDLVDGKHGRVQGDGRQVIKGNVLDG